MKLVAFRKLKKMMMLTTSDNDAEALASLRAANRIVAEAGVDWNRVFDRLVTVIDEVEEGPEDSAAKDHESRTIDRYFEAVDHGPKLSDGFSEFIESLRAQFKARGSLSAAQLDSLRRAAEKARSTR